MVLSRLFSFMVGTHGNKIESGKLNFEFYDDNTGIDYNGVSDFLVRRSLPNVFK